MKKLTRKEEELMQILWDLEQGFVKDILDRYSDPKPHYNTVSSLVRLLEERGFIGHRQYGNTHQYFPLISKEEYRKTFMRSVIRDYFDNSYKNVVSYFVEEDQLSPEELDDLFRMIKERKK